MHTAQHKYVRTERARNASKEFSKLLVGKGTNNV